MWQAILSGQPMPDAPKDRRFSAEEWNSHPLFAFIRQSYALIADRMLAVLAENRERYRAKPEDAEKLLDVGEAKSSAEIDAADLAAWTLLANAVLSSDATIVKD